jgi:hypothetical protein
LTSAGLHAGFSYDGLHLTGDVVEAVLGGGGYVDGLLHMLHSIDEEKLQNHPLKIFSCS